MLAIVGKTASGKDTIKKELVKLGMKSVVTTTTRPMRDGEIQDVSYHFITDEQFENHKKSSLFAETTSYETVHGTWHYGTLLKDLKDDKNKVVILNPDGIKSLANKIDMKNWLVVYIYCSDKTILERLKFRGDNSDEAKRRLKSDQKDFMNIERLVDISICNDNEKTPEELAKQLKTLYERRNK